MSWMVGAGISWKGTSSSDAGGVERSRVRSWKSKRKWYFPNEVGPCNLQAKGKRGLRLMCETKTGRGNARIMGWVCALFVLCPRHVYDGWDTLT